VGDQAHWIVVYPSRWKALLYLLMWLLVIGVGVLLIASPLPNIIQIHKVILASGFCLVFGGISAAASAYRLLSRQPLLVINEEGVFYKSSPGVGCFLRWKEIRRVEEFRYQVGVFLKIVPVNPAGLIAQHGPIARFQMAFTSSKLTDALNVPQEMLPMKAVELAEQINQRYGARFTCVPEQSSQPKTGTN
jgi:hypothetical protein